MFDFDGFERREAAIEEIAIQEAENVRARVIAKRREKIDMAELKRLDDEAREIAKEKMAIYGGDIEAQQKAADLFFGKGK